MAEIVAAVAWVLVGPWEWLDASHLYAAAAGLIVGVAIGLGISAALASFAYKRFLRALQPAQVQRQPYTPPQLGPKALRFIEKHPKPAAHQNDTLPREQMDVINLICNFIFQQLRDTINVKRQFLVIADRNFEFLLRKSPLGHFCKRLTVYDLNFGTTVPEINWISAVRPKLGTLANSDSLEVETDVSYEGKFNLTVKADLWASNPHPHWYFSFMEEPEVDLEVEAILDGRSMPQLATILKNQMHSVLKRHHVIPAKKVRYAPFFSPPPDHSLIETLFNNLQLYEGNLEVEVVGASGLKGLREDSFLYVNLSLDRNMKDDNARVTTGHVFEVTCLKAGAGGTIGVMFGQQSRSSTECRIEYIKPASPASDTLLRAGDVVTHINGLPIMKTSQAMRLIKDAEFEVRLTVSRPAEEIENEDLTEQHDICRTSLVACSDAPEWRQKFYFDLSSRHTTLYISVYDCLVNRPLSKRFKLLNSPTQGAVEAGLIHLTLKHEPQPMEPRNAHPDARASMQPEEASPTKSGGSRVASSTSDGPEKKAAGKAAHLTSAKPGPPSTQPPRRTSTTTSTAESMSQLPSKRHSVPTTSTVEARGEELFPDLPPQQRRKELEDMLNTVAVQIELESETKQDLERQLRNATTVIAQSRLQDNIEKSTERSQVLHTRALKCVSAIAACEDELAGTKSFKSARWRYRGEHPPAYKRGQDRIEGFTKSKREKKKLFVF
ncbi:uncharacterized protein MONBRDRAFT_25982 [Monosiga brevicollis MX1]|uniref:PDZ domain-containing protein n=1 Tax=Monosiga brevicollis TaxID=81824 RepID=A9V113_MONBE|nr:uncharacterized protein MONBRDRAFT_25982 [Monosiga brevicollis MX1]EDQ88727.1 predicted protein [Monosiga brevicollis MX1]|eukprot:XP_001746340.1 hypothetical protein [Monosiga brevicollis MX1]